MSEINYPRRYEGLRWRICFGRYDGVEKFAVNELQRERGPQSRCIGFGSPVQSRLPYVIEVIPESASARPHDGHEILIGTAANHPRTARLAEQGWVKAPRAARFYREILECKPAAMTATALIEDGMIEARIQPSVAVYAQTIWNPRHSDDELRRQAGSPYYRKQA